MATVRSLLTNLVVGLAGFGRVNFGNKIMKYKYLHKTHGEKKVHREVQLILRVMDGKTQVKSRVTIRHDPVFSKWSEWKSEEGFEHLLNEPEVRKITFGGDFYRLSAEPLFEEPKET